MLSIPAIALSGVYELYSERAELLHENVIGLVLSTIVSGIVGYLAIAFLINYLKTRSNLVFIIYRLVLGVIILALLYAGVLKNV